MKTVLSIFISLLFVSNLFAQTHDDAIKEIRTHFKRVNSITDFKTAELNNEDFLEHVPDNGASLIGYFKDNVLHKIVETIGISYALIVSEYYLNEGKLFFVYNYEKHYKQITDDAGLFVELDYSATEIKFEGRTYYKDDAVIKELLKGERTNVKQDFLKRFNEIKPLLLNKKQYQKEYDLLQGMWVSTEDRLSTFEIEGLEQVEYYSHELMGRFNIKVEDNYLYSTGVDGEVYKYEIISLTDSILDLLYSPSGRILTYERNSE